MNRRKFIKGTAITLIALTSGIWFDKSEASEITESVYYSKLNFNLLGPTWNDRFYDKDLLLKEFSSLIKEGKLYVIDDVKTDVTKGVPVDKIVGSVVKYEYKDSGEVIFTIKLIKNSVGFKRNLDVTISGMGNVEGDNVVDFKLFCLAFTKPRIEAELEYQIMG